MKCPRCGAPLSRAGETCTKCGSAGDVNLSDELPAGTIVAGKYRIVDTVGAGGMGRVYRAIQENLNTTFCIKTLHTGATADPQFAARFEREARTTSQLRHPNIVTVFDFGTHMDGSMYLVMEYVEGVPLNKVYKAVKVMSAGRAVHILGQVCDALTVAHARGVIHRDLKPANIMLTELPGQTDFVKVLDFGSALMLSAGEEAERLTRVGSVIGTPAYMAPEYLLGRGVDARVDVYAVGTLLYLLLTGSVPFRGESASVFAQQVSVQPELPTRRNPNADVSEAMEQVIMRSLVKDPAKRYATSAALKEAMENALRGVGDDTVPLDYDGGGVGVEVAHAERSVVILALRASVEVTKEDLQRVSTTAHSYGAEIQQSSGTVMLIFGLDREIPEAAGEAMKCAMALARMELRLKVGLHDAQVSCNGRYGTAGFTYELFGDGSQTAEHLARHVQPDYAIISGPAARHVLPELRLTPVLPPDDVNEPAFVLTDPLRSQGGPGELPFVGRQSEQRTLLEIAANASESRVCLLEAPEGMGKSRLVQAIVPQAARVGVSWCVVPASQLAEVGPAHPVSLVAALGWSSSSSSASTTERYAVEVMLGRRDQIHDGLSGERRQSRLVSAAVDGVARRVEHGPMVVVFDQLQTADDLTWSLVRRLVEMASALEVSIVLCVRDQSEIPFTPPDDAIRLTLPPLTEGELRSLGETPELAEMPAELLDLLVGSSSGVPLLVGEMYRVARAGDLSSLREISDMDPDAAIEHLLGRRVDALSDTARRILHASAVLGLQPLEEEVVALAGVADAPDTPAAVGELQSAGLHHRSVTGRLEFIHARVRDITLGAMTQAMQGALHERAAQLIEESSMASLRAGEFAEHVLRAGKHAQAFPGLRAAADLARSQGSYRRAIEYLQLALVAGEQLGDEHASDVADVARVLGQMFIEAGRLEEAEDVLLSAFSVAKEKGADEHASDLLRLHGTLLLLRGDRDGVGELEAALKYAYKMGFATVAAQAYGDLAQDADQRGDREQAMDFLQRGLGFVEDRQDKEARRVRIQLYNKLGRLELQADNMSGAVALFTQALSLADDIKDRYQAAGLLGNLGGAYARRGEMNRALNFTERALRASEALGDQIGVARQSYNLALIRLAGGNRGAARQLLHSSYDAARRSGWRDGLAMSTAALATLGDETRR